MRVFLAIARARSLGRAGRQLRQSQPTMGRRLRALEQAVGHALFHRDRDGFALTDAGMQVLVHAERMEEEALAFERQLAGSRMELAGTIRVSSSDWFGVHVLAPVFADFLEAHPLVTIELLTDARLVDLARREADLALRIQPFSEPGVVQRRLMHVPYGLYGATTAPLPSAATWRQGGQDARVIVLDEAYRDFPDAVWLRNLLPHARPVFASSNRDAQARMCACGMGWAVLPTALGDGMPELRQIKTPTAPPGRDVWLGYHQDFRRSARLVELVRLLTERLAS